VNNIWTPSCRDKAPSTRLFLHYLLNLDIPADIINNSVHARV
jgi:hypothetical protein